MTMRDFVRFLKQSAPFLLLLFAFYLDGVLKYHLGFLNTSNNNGLPQILLMVFVILSFRIDSSREMLIYSLIFGVLYDIYYFGIFGVNTVLFPLIVYLVYLVKEIIPDMFLFQLSVYLIALVLLHSLIYILGTVFNSVSLNFIDFITFVLWPTLFFNVIAFVVLYLPTIFAVDKMVEMRKEVL